MKTHRAGTRRRIEQNLKRHYELMQAYIGSGLTPEQASKAAFEELTTGKRPDPALKTAHDPR